MPTKLTLKRCGVGIKPIFKFLIQLIFGIHNFKSCKNFYKLIWMINYEHKSSIMTGNPQHIYEIHREVLKGLKQGKIKKVWVL